MANSKLLKEAIADAKAVRETAIANAKLALEEAFTPRLQSILSKKLQAEMEMEDDEEVVVDEELDSSEIGAGEGNTDSGTDARNPQGYEAHTELDPETTAINADSGEEDENLDVVDDLMDESTYEDPDDDVTGATYTEDEDMEFDEDELDLEEIIRELESELEDDEEVHTEYQHDDDEEVHTEYGHDDEEEVHTEDEELDIEFEDDEEVHTEMEDDEEVHTEEDEFSDEIDLDEILREMGYGDDEEEMHTEEEMEDDVVDATAELEAELGEAYSTIKELRKTINEVNLLNAKLLYTNKLFRSYNLTNEQKMKVVENLDRTGSVREVKLVYATLAESMNFSGTERKGKKSITEGFASKATKSTAPKREIISEGNDMADRFKKLAGINKF
jgi:hypothetical protein